MFDDRACKVCGEEPVFELQIKGTDERVVAWSCADHLTETFDEVKLFDDGEYEEL